MFLCPFIIISSAAALAVPALGVEAVTALQLVEVIHTSDVSVAVSAKLDFPGVLCNACVLYHHLRSGFLLYLCYCEVVSELLADVPAYFFTDVRYPADSDRVGCDCGQNTQVGELVLVVLEVASLELSL